jgi:hypothetical protein
MEHYRLDNTTGYTEAELAAFNYELEAYLAYAVLNNGDDLTTDEVQEIIKQHNDDVARR